MDQYLELITVYTVQDVLPILQRLREAGLDVRCEEPALTGNYVVDWQVATPTWTVWVAESDHAEALAILGPIETEGVVERETEESSSDQSIAVEEALDSFDSVAAVLEREGDRKALLALRASVFSLFACLILPIAIWLVITARSGELSARGKKRLNAADKIMFIAFVVWSVLLAAPWIRALFAGTR